MARRIRGTELAEALARDDVDAVILCTPTQLHAAQAIAAMRAGKHVQVEIPLADSWADAQAVRRSAAGDRPGLHGRPHPAVQPVATSGCTSRIVAGELRIQQMDVQTYFFRRTNMNALGRAAQLDRPPAVAPRRAHGRPVRVPDRRASRRRQRDPGPDPPRARHRDGHVDPAARPRAARSARCRFSFNNDGPLGTFFRYICDNGTYIARYDDLVHRQGGADRRLRRSTSR